VQESGIKPKEEPEGSGLILTINDNTLFGDWEPDREVEKSSETTKKVNKLVKEELKNFFRPEHDIWDISAIMIKQLADRLQEKGLTLDVTEPVRALLVEEGHDPLYGARPLRRVIMHY